MQLYRHQPDTQNFIRSVARDSVTVVDRAIAASFLVGPDALVEGWGVRSVDAIDDAAIDAVLALAPEVVILGTGAKHVFPPQRVLAAFLTRRIGLEAMDNAAAGRTFNVLADEGRRVVAAFIL